jgi:diacylglycerol O-acyltransferase / wax synthase
VTGEDDVVDQMSALDAEFLHLEDGVNHLHIGACARFEGPAPTEAELFDLMDRCLDRIPRYRQRVHTLPFQLGRPVWQDDPGFDLAQHLSHSTLDSADDAALQDLLGEVMSTELDRRRPLWEMWLVEGLPGDEWALLAKVHHCMVDGVAGVGLMEEVLDPAPDTERGPERAVPWSAAPGPSETRLVTDALGDLATTVIRWSAQLLSSLARPGEAISRLRTLTSGVSSWLGEAWPTPSTSVDGTVGPERCWRGVHIPLAEAKAIRAERGGTVNDVILTAVTRGFRDLLLARGEDPKTTEIRTLVPVSVRTEHGRLDNEVSAMVADLPVEIAVPELRYEAVRSETRWLKLSHEAEAIESVTSLADLVPAPLMAYGSRVAAAVLRRHPQRSINTVTTNVPGPSQPLFAAGRRMVAYYPYVPVAFGVRFAVAILSYDGELYFGVTGDRASADDIDVLAEGIEAGVAELYERQVRR